MSKFIEHHTLKWLLYLGAFLIISLKIFILFFLGQVETPKKIQILIFIFSLTKNKEREKKSSLLNKKYNAKRFYFLILFLFPNVKVQKKNSFLFSLLNIKIPKKHFISYYLKKIKSIFSSLNTTKKTKKILLVVFFLNKNPKN